jgi:hypothetical protein
MGVDSWLEQQQQRWTLPSSCNTKGPGKKHASSQRAAKVKQTKEMIGRA